MTPASLMPALQLSVRAAVAAGLAVAIAQRLQFSSPMITVIGAVIVTDLSPERTRESSTQRLAGTIVGAIVGASMSDIVPAGGWGVLLSVLPAMFFCHLLQLKPAAVKLAGFACGVVIVGHASAPWSYAVSRTMETILGIGCAVLVSYLPKLLRIDETEGAGSSNPD